MYFVDDILACSCTLMLIYLCIYSPLEPPLDLWSLLWRSDEIILCFSFEADGHPRYLYRAAKRRGGSRSSGSGEVGMARGLPLRFARAPRIFFFQRDNTTDNKHQRQQASLSSGLLNQSAFLPSQNATRSPTTFIATCERYEPSRRRFSLTQRNAYFKPPASNRTRSGYTSIA